MIDNITPETVRHAIANTDPFLDALSVVLREISHESVQALATVLSLMGVGPADLPGEFLLQAVLVESERTFKPISRETWLDIYDAYHRVKAIVDADPSLQSALGVTTPDAPASDALLDGQF